MEAVLPLFYAIILRLPSYVPVNTNLSLLRCVTKPENTMALLFSATRPYSPRDKAMVERAVNIVYTHIYAPLRHHFTSIKALNQAMYQQLLILNDKPYKNTVHSRWYYYDLQEKATLRSLPSESFSLRKQLH